MEHGENSIVTYWLDFFPKHTMGVFVFKANWHLEQIWKSFTIVSNSVVTFTDKLKYTTISSIFV